MNKFLNILLLICLFIGSANSSKEQAEIKNTFVYGKALEKILLKDLRDIIKEYLINDWQLDSVYIYENLAIRTDYNVHSQKLTEFEDQNLPSDNLNIRTINDVNYKIIAPIHSCSAHRMVVSNDGKKIALLPLKVIDVNTGNDLQLKLSGDYCVNVIAFSPDAKYLASSTLNLNPTIDIIDIETSKIKSFNFQNNSPVTEIPNLGYSFDGKLIAAVFVLNDNRNNQKIMILDSNTGIIQKMIDMQGNYIRNNGELQFNGKYIALCQENKEHLSEIVFYDTDGKLIQTNQLGQPSLNFIRLTKNNDFLILGFRHWFDSRNSRFILKFLQNPSNFI